MWKKTVCESPLVISSSAGNSSWLCYGLVKQPKGRSHFGETIEICTAVIMPASSCAFHSVISVSHHFFIFLGFNYCISFQFFGNSIHYYYNFRLLISLHDLLLLVALNSCIIPFISNIL